LWCPAAIAFVLNVVVVVFFSSMFLLGVHINFHCQVFIRPRHFVQTTHAVEYCHFRL
jgi:hypothetical protein